MMIIENTIDFNTLLNILKVKAAIELNYITQSTGDAYISELISEKYLYTSFGTKENYLKVLEQAQNRKTRRELEKNKEKQRKEEEYKKNHNDKSKKKHN